VRWVGAGAHARAVMDDPAWAHEHPHGHAVDDAGSDAATGRALCQHLETGGYDGVFVNVRMRPVEMNVVRYLPAHIRRIMIVHSTQPGTYGPAASLRHHVHATVGVSPRIRKDLISRKGFDPSQTFTILNGIDTQRFGERHRSAEHTIRLIYLGRIDEQQKGVFWLPHIMRRLSGLPVELSVAGNGPDLEKLERRCRNLADRVHFLGKIPADQVAGVLSDHDLLLLPSRYEGLGLSLIEAMASGCVPIASSLADVTTAVITHGVDGFLFPVGYVDRAAEHIRALVKDPTTRQAMAHAAQHKVRREFDLDTMARRYMHLIESLDSMKLGRSPLPDDSWRYPIGFNNPLRRMIPAVVKRWALAR
jgi:glycosyltransferase involved in cell wall biosynthesis